MTCAALLGEIEAHQEALGRAPGRQRRPIEDGGEV